MMVFISNNISNIIRLCILVIFMHIIYNSYSKKAVKT